MVFAVPSFALFKRFLLQEGSSLLFGIQQEGENCMTISIVQTFNPPLRLYTGVEKVSVKSREWQMGENLIVSDGIQIMGYMGQCQVEEVWKRYREDSDIYVSNYGYEAKITDDEAKSIFREETLKALLHSGARFVCLNETEKGLITRCNRVPTNKKKSGCKIWLQIDGLDVHVMVAEKFLDKPEGAWGVHHIDNNSYNNSVTNLVWVTRGQHNRRIHPMSYR